MLMTEVSICRDAPLGLSSLCPLQLFGQCGHDLKDVADYAVVGNFKDGRVLIFVDGDNSARALHSDHVLNGAADSERQVQFWRDGLAGAADLALHWQPAFIANRPRSSNLRAHCF